MARPLKGTITEYPPLSLDEVKVDKIQEIEANCLALFREHDISEKDLDFLLRMITLHWTAIKIVNRNKKPVK